MLLNRPGFNPTKYTETICDADGHIANVWRALQFSPDETAKWADWPVNHADLSARKKVLNEKNQYLLENLIKDDMWHDSKLAGYWIWAASCWIGSGLTRPTARPHIANAGIGVHKISQIPHIADTGIGVHKISQIPHLADAGMGVHKISQIPHLANAGIGVHKISKRPHIADAGIGVHKISQIPHIADAGKGVQEIYNENIYTWFRQLSERLRHVRVVCGDWTRVCGGNWQDKFGPVGIYFDPPYENKDRRAVYAVDCFNVGGLVRKWAIERGELKDYRICISGYDMNNELSDHGWESYSWETGGGYSNVSGKKNDNCSKEILWMSPNCNSIDKQVSLF